MSEMNENYRYPVTPDDVELVRLKFIEIAQRFDKPPRRGLCVIEDLVRKDLGLTEGRVRNILYTRLCNPLTSFYDPEVKELKNRMRSRWKVKGGGEVKTGGKVIVAEPIKAPEPKSTWFPQPVKSYQKEWEYSETQVILENMEARLEKVESENKRLREENETLKRRNGRQERLLMEASFIERNRDRFLPVATKTNGEDEQGVPF